MEDVDTIRATNNGIFDDIFWVHLAYATAEDGIDRGRRILDGAPASAEARRQADDLVWAGRIVTSVVPRFRRFDADTRLVDASLGRILDEARVYASAPCVVPRSPRGQTKRKGDRSPFHF